MLNTIYLFSFVETPRKFIIAELSIYKIGSSSVLVIIRLFEGELEHLRSVLKMNGYTKKLYIKSKGF